MASTSPTGSVAKLVLTSLAVMSGAFTFGLESGTVAGFQVMESWLKDFGYYDEQLHAWNIKTNIQTTVGAMILVGAVLGSIIAGPIGSNLGRKPGLIAIGVSAILGAILQVVYAHLALLLLGRLLQGVAIGLASNFIPVYQSEVAPTKYRGIMVSLYQLGINIGGLIGTCINIGTHGMPSRWAYHIPLITSLVFPSILVIVTTFLPESPRWLLSVDRADDARKSLRRLRGREYPESAIQQEIESIAVHIALEREVEASTSYIDLFRGSDRRRTTIVLMVLLFQILSGITFINAYGTFFFSVSGISDTFLVTVISSVCQLAGLIFLYPSLRFLGRRTILLWGGAAEVVCLFLFAILGVAMPGSQVAAKCLVAFTLLYGFFFTWSWGPVGWVVASETSTNTLRSKTQSFGTAVNWTASLVVSIVIPYLINPTAANLGGKVGFIFGSLTFVGLIWTYFYLPETGGRSLEELDELFLNNVPARKFSTYQLTGQVGDRRGSVGDIHKEDVSTSHTENKV